MEQVRVGELVRGEEFVTLVTRRRGRALGIAGLRGAAAVAFEDGHAQALHPDVLVERAR